MSIRQLSQQIIYDSNAPTLISLTNNHSASLTNQQNLFLSFLISNPNSRCSKTQIEEYIWNDDTAHDGDIARIAAELRKKLDDLCGTEERKKILPNAIKNAGYILRISAPPEAHPLPQAQSAGSCTYPAVSFPEAYTRALLMEVNGHKEEAFALHQQLAQQGYPASVNFLGVAYMKGIGVERDRALGITFYQKAVELLYTPAMLNLGDYYMDPMGGCYQPAEAARLYLKAATHNPPDGDAMFRLSICYQHGRGVDPNPQEAEKWRLKAAENGVTTYVDYYQS